MNIFDKARKLMAQSPRQLTLSEAMAELGRRGALKRQSNRPKKQPAVSYWWQRD